MKIFLTGATGYVGGTVANRLVEAGHQVQGLVRTQAGAARLGELGITPILGDLADSALLKASAQAADAVVNAANADDRFAVEALLAGLAGSGKTFVHTSGSGVVADDAEGRGSDAVYDDDTPVRPLPVRQGRFELNTLIISANDQGVRTTVIAPPMIYGHGLGAHVDSIQIPKLLSVARQLGQACYVCSGANRWSNVHVEDLADLYVLAVEKAPAGLYCYAENGENSMFEIATAISDSLRLAAPKAMEMSEAITCFGEMATRYSFGSNSRVRALKARELLGWSPSRPSLIDEIAHGCYASSKQVANLNGSSS